MNRTTIEITGNHIMAMLAIILFFSAWNVASMGEFNASAVLFFVLFTVVVTSMGAVFSMMVAGSVGNVATTFAFIFTTGYFIFSIILLAVLYIIPVSLIIAFCIVISILLGLLFVCRNSLIINLKHFTVDYPLLIGILISLVAVSLWCRDSISPLLDTGSAIIYKPWIDGFIHTSYIRMIAFSEGASTFNDIRLAGQPAPFYHYASYVAPALLKSFSSATGTLAAFGSFLVPLGYFLTALAAYALVASWWGSWPALTALLALMLLPDAYQHGMNNSYYSYHWLQNTAPAGLYGTALLAIAWLFMIRGTLSGRILPIILSYCSVLAAISFKAHFFVLNAFLLLVYPALFFPKISLRNRVVACAALIIIFSTVTTVSKNWAWAPYLVVDGSALPYFLQGVVAKFEPASSLAAYLPDFATTPVIITVLWGVVILFLCTLGVYGILFLLLFPLRVRIEPYPVLFFPALIILNFLFMSLFLAFERGTFGTKDEFLHRPFGWVYFAIIIWTAGCLHNRFLGDRPPAGARIKAICIAIMMLFLFIPYRFGDNVQRGPKISGTYLSNKTLDRGLLQTLEYVRTHSRGNDIIQDSMCDWYFIGSAFSERQYYVIKPFYNPSARPSPISVERKNQVFQLMGLTMENEIVAFAKAMNIKWFILYPGSPVAWHPLFLNNPEFTSGGYRAYRFDKV